MNPSQFSPSGKNVRGGRFIAAGRLNATGIALLRAGMSQQFCRAKSDLAGMAMVSMISLPDSHDPVNFCTAIHFCLTVDKQQRVAVLLHRIEPEFVFNW